MLIANNRPGAMRRARERNARLTKQDRRVVEAGFDLTRTTHENKRHWADADALSGRSAYNPSDRHTARMRSRLEASNNSWYSGMLRTASAHIIGTGPRLQVMTQDDNFNRRVERAWKKWARRISLVANLRMMVETYWRDGDTYIIRGSRPSLNPITLDVRFYEAEQCARPYNRGNDPSLEDGIRIDSSGNPIEYWFLKNHPGDVTIGHVNFLDGEWFKAEDVIHLFRKDRPGQLCGFPRCAPALDWLAHMRRFSKATLSTAEAAALWGIFVRTTGTNVVAARMPTDFHSVHFERNAMNFLPEGWEPSSVDAKHPATSNESYQRTELTYFCRCTGMPYSLAAGTSRDSNFASAKMDIKNTWEPEVKAEQSHIDITVMATIFHWFLEDLAISTDILDEAGMLDEIDYQFFWPPLPVSDEGDQASARATRLKTGQSTFSTEAAEQGLDDDMLCQAAARDNNCTVEEFKKARFNATFGIAPASTPPAPPPSPPKPVQESVKPKPTEADFAGYTDLKAGFNPSQERADNGQFGSGGGSPKTKANHASTAAKTASSIANKSGGAMEHALASIHHENAAASHRAAAKSGNASFHNKQAAKHEKAAAHHDQKGAAAFGRQAPKKRGILW